jgi:hypothetical protein
VVENILGEDPRLGRALTAIERGQQAQVVLRYLEEYLLGRQQQLDTELFGAGEAEWPSIVRQKIEAHKFILNLSALLQGGASAGRILGPLLERNNVR